MAKWTPEQTAARQRMVSQKNMVRTALIAGDVARAESIAKKGGFEIFDARLAPVYKNAAEPFFVALEQTYKAGKDFAGDVQPVAQPADNSTPAFIEGVDDTVEPPEAVRSEPEPAEINGWPTHTDAVVWGFPVNTRLVIIELPDKRRASCWRGRKQSWRIFERVRVRLETATPDPIYEIEKLSKPTW